MAEVAAVSGSADATPAGQELLRQLRAFSDRVTSPRFEYGYKILWVHSPVYEEYWRATYDEYDRLEQRRQALGVSRQDWQDVVEGMYQVVKDSREETFTEIDDSGMDNAPLGYALYDYQAMKGQKIAVDRAYGWRTALKDWEDLNGLYASSKEFRAHLTNSQIASFEILDDWWNARYYPTTDLDLLRTYLRVLSAKPLVEKPLDNANVSYEWVSHSHYHSMLLELWIREFHPMEWEPYARRSYLGNLMAVRAQASEHAMNMRFAYASFMGRSGAPQDSSVQLPRYPEPVRDMSGWKGNHFFEEQPSGAIQREGFETLLDLATAPPKYLWNVAEKAAVRVSDMGSVPDYLCISHTWGRFCHRPERWVDVPGVQWPVKTNTLYDVRDVPDMLAGFGADYVWLDLFCLPQKESPEHHEEVANQTAIFRRAKACVAWLNEVETWAVTKKALEYIGLAYLQKTCSLPELQPDPADLEALYGAAQGHSELLKPKSVEPAPWFSSLWTLQETALCPNLRICTKRMEVLKDNLGTPISMTTLFTLVQTPSAALSIGLTKPVHVPSLGPMGWPNAVRCIRRLNGTTRLGWLLTYLSPMDIMVHANYRVCKRARAPAIMSALGVLDWYKDWVAKDDERQRKNKQTLEERKKKSESRGKPFNEDEEKKRLTSEPLLLDTFPIEFVHEAAQKIGSAFYSVLTIINVLRMEGFEAVFGYGDIQVGSMMPFTSVHGWDSPVYAAITFRSLQRRDHESVAGWKIMPDGSVRMSSVGILASSNGGELLKSVDSLVVIAGKENDKFKANTDPSVDLKTKLKELAGTDSIYYAVALAADLGLQSGIILQTSRKKMPLNKRYLMKVGLFRTHQRAPVPPPKSVNWSVV